MTGRYYHTLDAKGRLSIPVRLRDEFGESFYVTVGTEITPNNTTEKYLTGYTNESWNRLMEKLLAMPGNERNAYRAILSRAQLCDIDGQGRILIPPHLRDWAALKKNVTIVGFGDCAQIWDTDMFTAVDEAESSPENLAKTLAASRI